MSVLSLCSGYGGLELALNHVLNPGPVLAYCDNYKPARHILKTHNPHTPIYDNVTHPALKHMRPNIITFGFPCQDLSRAGKQAGLNGPKSSLYYECMQVVEATTPSLIVIENVPQLTKYKTAIDNDLNTLGYTTSWATVQACDAGLPHRRKRVFILAQAHNPGPIFTRQYTPPKPAQPTLPTPTVVDMGWGRTPTQWETWKQTQKTKHNNGNGHGRSLYQIAGEATLQVMEHLMGLPNGYITNQDLSEAAQRRLLGNGVAPPQGALGIYTALTQKQ